MVDENVSLAYGGEDVFGVTVLKFAGQGRLDGDFPQIEALKAQAVAARTYAMAHLGESAAKGYDVCATPSFQVYRGQSSEHPLSDRAVADTRGVVATWRGRPIHAYYTSTCGGHTEDGAPIFDDAAP